MKNEYSPELIATETPSKVVLQPEQAQQVLDAFLEMNVFLTRRDQMNAAMHSAEVKWSPLTDKVHDAMNMLNTVVVEQYKADIQ